MEASKGNSNRATNQIAYLPAACAEVSRTRESLYHAKDRGTIELWMEHTLR
jgi:hypothetical protein